MAEGRVVSATSLEFVSAVAHDFQASVAAIKGAVTALRGTPGLDDETRDRLLGVLGDAAEQLGLLVDDLLLAGRLEAGRLPIELASCEALPVAQTVVEAARVAAPEGVSIRLSAVAGLPEAAADPDRLRQVIANLVDNALKHSPAGGSVDVRLEEAGARLLITVSDEGPGIPADERERIFERFRRGSTSTPGTGLGLYLARELAAAMGGTITVESEPGKGCSFRLALPLARP
jgi:signal transduction histidine kinase